MTDPTEDRWSLSMRILLGQTGHIPAAAAFPHDVSTAAYIAHLAWVYGRTSGILKGRPGYEAAELLGSRIRAAASRSGTGGGPTVSIVPHRLIVGTAMRGLAASAASISASAGSPGAALWRWR